MLGHFGYGDKSLSAKSLSSGDVDQDLADHLEDLGESVSDFKVEIEVHAVVVAVQGGHW
jgi:hypothetical protein